MILRLALWGYRLAWLLLWPLVLLYLWRRGRRDADYSRHIAERFGFYPAPLPQGAIWVHAVSLGEIRSAQGLIRLMLARGDRVIVTNITPAGRRETQRLFAPEIARGQVAVVWAPFDMPFALRRFLRACRPRIGLPLEVEIWPEMIFTCRAMGVPLYLCNAQYAEGPLARDGRGLRLRQRLIGAIDGAFVKSQLQAQRFRSVGLRNLQVTGELRFDQPIPPAHLDAGAALRGQIGGREVITIASGVADEEALYRDLILQMQGAEAPLFVYVPRAPERFDAVVQGLEGAGLLVARRSQCLDADLAATAPLDGVDVLVGDSFGEMYFYLALADRVIVGAGFTPKGAHNIIEALSLGKPVLTGPVTWTIEYPFVEAEAAGIAVSVPDLPALLAELRQEAQADQAAIARFLAEHGGASARTLAAIDAVAGRVRAEHAPYVS
ncbi:3-deoxy-D-manno-octulosonic acid transferase [Natronohydrobacter thiooxidans]|uniref:3-deoxy-D-manno-octulosonic acid transferase n=1 Tax=Natronohydrobacter thiooxidans TaxID=87172 RepID=UPI0008FF52C9|nr:glycosyltransferase N-terminal domain-containing protein [Natronohydrobacter thiooxidans]